MPRVTLPTVLAAAKQQGWPQIIYRSPIMNERYHLAAGQEHWRRWAADALTAACDLPVVLDVLRELGKGD